MQKGFTTFMKTERGFAPILIILLTTLVIGGYLFFKNYQITIPALQSQSNSVNSETEGWLTYRISNKNDGWGYSIRYPSGWRVYEEREQKGSVWVAYVAVAHLQDIFPTGFSIDMMIWKGHDTGRGEKDIIIDGTSAKKFDSDCINETKARGGPPYTLANIVIPKGNYDYSITLLSSCKSYYANEPTAEWETKAKELFDQSLSTFKFTN